MENQYPAFENALNDEDASFKIVSKSVLTQEIEDADKKRDVTFSGIRDQIKALQKHFDAEIAVAASRLQILFGAYGNLSRKSFDQETADIYNLLQDLNGKHKTDVETIGFARWIEQLDAENKAFDTLMKLRFDENAEKSALTRLRVARVATDDAYKAIVERVNAGIVFIGEDKYKNFVTDINIRVDRFNHTIAQRKGIADTTKTTTGETSD